MRRALLLALFLAVPATAQTYPPPYTTAPWSPTSEYITVGQDEPGYRAWIAADRYRPAQVTAFHRYLGDSGVSFIVPTWQLLRTATDWQKCGAAPFEVPPPEDWPNLVQTLRFIRYFVIPAVGPVEPVSGYRNPSLNRCAGGAPESVHMHFSAVDLVPLRTTDRQTLMARLCGLFAAAGARYQLGLGFYTKLRFHVDSSKYRTWGRNDAGTLACPSPIASPLPDLAVLQPVSGVTVHRAAPMIGPPAPLAPVPRPIAGPPTDPLAPLESTSPR